jgi:cyclohexanone monooxygenase
VASAYADLLVNRKSNDTAADFVRSKIGEVVADPELRKTLSPDYAFACKRPCLDNTDTGFYELFNRDDVRLVDLRSTPLVEITESGVRTSQRSFEFDTIVYATGFDAMTGAVGAIDIRGRDGAGLRDKWADGPSSYLGLATEGFPNLFMVTGPLSPSVLTNMVISIEDHVDLITGLIEAAGERGVRAVEATAEAEQDWMQRTSEVAAMTLYPETDSWYNGSNVAGKSRSLMVYVGGLAGYRQICDQMVAKGYEGFSFS